MRYVDDVASRRSPSAPGRSFAESRVRPAGLGREPQRRVLEVLRLLPPLARLEREAILGAREVLPERAGIQIVDDDARSCEPARELVHLEERARVEREPSSSDGTVGSGRPGRRRGSEAPTGTVTCRCLGLEPREEVEARHALEPFGEDEHVSRTFERRESPGRLAQVLDGILDAPPLGAQVLGDGLSLLARVATGVLRRDEVVDQRLFEKLAVLVRRGSHRGHGCREAALASGAGRASRRRLAARRLRRHRVGLGEDRVGRVRVPDAARGPHEVRRQGVAARGGMLQGFPDRVRGFVDRPLRELLEVHVEQDVPRRALRFATASSCRRSAPPSRAGLPSAPPWPATAGSRGGSKNSIAWIFPATRTSKSAATSPNTGRSFLSRARTSSVRTWTSSVATMPPCFRGVSCGLSCAATGAAHSSRSAAGARARRAFERTVRSIAACRSRVRAEGVETPGLQLFRAGASDVLGYLKRPGLAQVFLDDEVEEHLAHAVLPARLEDAAHLARFELDARHGLEVLAEHRGPGPERDDEDEKEDSREREEDQSREPPHLEEGRRVHTPSRPGRLAGRIADSLLFSIHDTAKRGVYFPNEIR